MRMKEKKEKQNAIWLFFLSLSLSFTAGRSIVRFTPEADRSSSRKARENVNSKPLNLVVVRNSYVT